MKRKLFIRLTLVFASVAAVVYVMAQQVPRLGTGKLAQVGALISGGNPQQATNLLATIKPADPEFLASGFYKALAFQKLGDDRRFLETMSALTTNSAAVPRELKENLAFKEIEALYHYRRFEELLRKTRAFPQNHLASTQSTAVTEYQMAGLFERGLKNAYDARNLKDDAQLNRRWAEATTNLQEFLGSASAFQGTNYSFIPKRVLQDDVWRAHIILGDGDATLAEISASDLAARERFSFLRIQLLVERLQRDRIDQNLALLTDFLRQFPESQHLSRVAFDLYNCSFHKGKQLCLEADAAEKSGDTTGAQERRSLAREHFKYVRSLRNHIRPDEAAGIEPSDVLDYRDDVLETYYLEKNYASLQSASAALLAESAPGDVGWMIGKLYTVVGLLTRPTPNTPEAATILDEILAQGFRNKPDHDHWIIAAAKWRIDAARRLGDTKKGPELVRWIRDADCAKNIKTDFLRIYGAMAGSKN